MHQKTIFHGIILCFLLALLSTSAFAAGSVKPKRKGHTARKATPVKFTTVSYARRKHRSRRSRYNPYTEPTYGNPTAGDRFGGEDPVVRAAAVRALGPLNGAVVVVDPQTGRVLSIVNQKLALEGGFQPCSTIKIVVALSGLSEGVIERNTPVRLYGRTSMTLTEALAHSNNFYFANLGAKLGYERVTYYARLFGLGERAGLNIEGEQPGIWPAEPPKFGGVGMMTSFGSGIALTPLEFAALLSAIANGGALYSLQYPHTEEEAAQLVPQVKRRLDIEQWIPEIKPGMMGAVDHGTARRANYDPNEPIMGKTGTCTDERRPGVHLGWFGSFNDIGGKKLVVVVLLTGGRSVSGPVASGVAGLVYKSLSDQKYFARRRGISPVALISTQVYCAAR